MLVKLRSTKEKVKTPGKLGKTTELAWEVEFSFDGEKNLWYRSKLEKVFGREVHSRKKDKNDISFKWTREKIKLIWIGQLQDHKSEKTKIKRREKIHIHTHPFYHHSSPCRTEQKKNGDEKRRKPRKSPKN